MNRRDKESLYFSVRMTVNETRHTMRELGLPRCVCAGVLQTKTRMFRLTCVGHHQRGSE